MGEVRFISSKNINQGAFYAQRTKDKKCYKFNIFYKTKGIKQSIQPMRLFIGGTPEEVPEKYDELSSIRRIKKNVPPILFLHGTKDISVSHEQSVAFHNKLQELWIYSEVELYPGKQHAWFNKEPDKTITIKRMKKFLIEQFNLK